MNYDDLINDAQSEAKQKELSKIEEQEKQLQITKENTLKLETAFKVLVVDELEKLASSLNKKGISASTGNGDTQYGPRRTIHIDPQKANSVYGIVFQCFTSGESPSPHLRYYFVQDGFTPKDPIRHAEYVGRQHEITSEQVQAIIQEFIKLAIV